MKLTGLPIPQKGFTLIEIMIALVLGAFLIGGVLQIFVNTRETYRMQDALSRLQENGRFAMDFIGRDLRMAGYSFCPKSSDDDPIVNFLTGVNGGANGPAQDYPDSIQIRWREGNQCPIVAADLRVSYSIAPVPPAPGTPLPTGVVYNLVRDAGDGDGVGPDAIPLIEGVENMQILYGVDADSGSGRAAPEFFGTSADVTDMADVVSIRVSLLLHSTDEFVLKTPVAINFNNEPTRADRRIRRVFTSTFTLRNRRGVSG